MTSPGQVPVLLVGGPFSGEVVTVDPARSETVLHLDGEPEVQHVYARDGRTVSHAGYGPLPAYVYRGVAD